MRVSASMTHADSDEVPVAANGGREWDRIDGWRVCWPGSWDKCRVFFVVIVVKEYAGVPRSRPN